MRDFRFSLPRKHAIANGAQDHWYDRDEKMMKAVLKRITSEGPLMAKDFEHKGKKIGEWQTKPAKRALETLFMQGDLMVPSRINFHKVYDLTERVLPSTLDTSKPSDEEYARYLITRFLRANGLGQPAEIAYLLSGIKQHVSATLNEMIAAGEVIETSVAADTYYALPDALKLLGKPLSRSKAKILSPFDNLVIQRKRMNALFGFDYLIECYVPQPKRQYGYFTLPVLWDGGLVARMDCKVDRRKSLLHINHLALEPSVTKIESLFSALYKELISFLKFNNCNQLLLHKVTPAKAKPALQRLISELTP